MKSDAALIGLALRNLLGNAIKFSATGVVTVSTNLVVNGSAVAWQFAVRDQGPGIPADRTGQLFSAFVRGETHGQGGMRLGLSIASQAVRRLGGQLAVESKVGFGSTFSFTVPAKPSVG